MNVITHTLVGWVLASSVPSASRAQKGWIVAASVAPDIDGLGLMVELATRNSPQPLYWWSEYHHVLAHNLPFAALLSVAALIFTRRPLIALAVIVASHLHLAGDLIGSRAPDGYQWPIPYLWPFSPSPELAVSWQWALNAWPNLAISCMLLLYTLWLARSCGSSPLELVSERANTALVSTLRDRFPLPHAQHQ
jgi:inner membrane protein